MTTPAEFYCFVNLEGKSLVTDDEGYFSYWETEFEAIQTVQNILKEAPTFPMKDFGVAKVTVTTTEYTKERKTLFHNIEVIHYFTDLI